MHMRIHTSHSKLDGFHLIYSLGGCLIVSDFPLENVNSISPILETMNWQVVLPRNGNIENGGWGGGGGLEVSEKAFAH